MPASYARIALRYIRGNKIYSFINLFGLALGMACCFLMLMWVTDELNWDRFQSNVDTLFRVEQDQPTPQGYFHVNVTPYPMGPALKEEIPEIKDVTRIVNLRTVLIRVGSKAFYETNAASVDVSYLNMFSFPLVKGTVESALATPESIVLSEDVAKKYFGNEDPLGKTLIVNNRYQFKVAGVIQSPPPNTSLTTQVLFPFSFEKRRGVDIGSWQSNQIVTWVQLYDRQDVAEVDAKITELQQRHVQGDQNSRAGTVQFRLMPLSDLHLFAKFGFGRSIGTIQSVSLFSVMAFLILLIASINFMNLSTAQSARKAKEVGLRKVLGAMRTSLTWRFYSESILMTVLAAVIALGIVELLLPVFNSVSGKNFSGIAPFQASSLPGIALVVLLTGVIAGSYPAIVLAGFRPIDVLKGHFRSSEKGALLRKVLVVLQFALSVILIICTFMLSRQLEFMKGEGLGYDKEQLIYLSLRGETQTTYARFKKELQSDPLILGVTGTGQLPTRMSANGGGADWDGKDPNFRPLIGYAAVDYDYLATFKIPLAAGRAFSRGFPSDSVSGVLVNESLAKLIGGGSVVGKRFTWANDGRIVGVMKDYHYSAVQSAIEPQAVYLVPGEVTYAVVRLQAGNITRALGRVKEIWSRVNADYPFEYRFVDEDFAAMFQTDNRVRTLFRYASLFAIVVACLGLFGLASYMAEDRTREIGVRKVLGASVYEISFLFSQEFMKWVLLANVLAWPLSYFIVNKVLEEYSNRIPFLWWTLPVALLLSAGMAIATVSYQSIRAARGNPVDALKHE